MKKDYKIKVYIFFFICMINLTGCEILWAKDVLHIPEHGHFGKLPIREELSNSGNILKLLVPNGGIKAAGSRKATIINTSNYFCKYNRLCKVTSQMMTERKIDNRGSKSISVILLKVMEYSICVSILLPGK